MKIYTSYFSQIRNFTKNMIPVSTAIWDPKWFHTGNNIGEYKDSRGVWNGIRMPILSPISIDVGECVRKNNCDPQNCNFLKQYQEYLNSLDFNKIYTSLEKLAERVKKIENFDELPVIVLIVYESPNNPCSEREALQKFFTSHGIICTELEYPINKERSF